MKNIAGRKILRSAFALDRRGKEAAAIPLYQKALRLGLNQSERRDAMICLASSLRTIGKFSASLTMLRRAARLFPNDRAIRLFTVLVYHDQGRHSAALRLIGSMYLAQSRDRKIVPYRSMLLRKFRSL